MKILSLSIGGGGAAINNSVRTLLYNDYLAAATVDQQYADLLYGRLKYRYADSNNDSLRFIVEPAERLLLGTDGRGCAHDPKKGYAAFMQSRELVKAVMSPYDVIFLPVTTGKGTGAGSIEPAVELAHELKKLVIPIVAMPSLSAREVSKARYDEALEICARLDKIPVRYIQVMNDAAYELAKSEEEAMKELNATIAKGLRALMYAFLERSQFDRSDIATFFAGMGRIRLGYAELTLDDANPDKNANQCRAAAQACHANKFYGFEKPIGSTLICVQGKIDMPLKSVMRGEIARLAIEPPASTSKKKAPDNPHYSPHNADAVSIPKPWCVTAMFTEYTGEYEPLQIDWLADETEFPARYTRQAGFKLAEATPPTEVAKDAQPVQPRPVAAPPTSAIPAPPAFPWTFKEFERRINLNDSTAIQLAKAPVDTTKVSPPVPGEEFKRMFEHLGLRQAISKKEVFSESWLTCLRQAVKAETLTSKPYKRSTLRDLPLNKIVLDLELSDADHDVRRDVLFIQHVAECFGSIFAQEMVSQTTASASAELPVPDNDSTPGEEAPVEQSARETPGLFRRALAAVRP